MTEVRLSCAIPVLRIHSVVDARAFYLDFLGFALDWEHRFAPDLPLYAQISRGAVRLHLSEHSGDGTLGSVVFVWLRGLHAWQRELVAKASNDAPPEVEDAPWDAWVMEVADPFGNRLSFSEPKQRNDPRA